MVESRVLLHLNYFFIYDSLRNLLLFEQSKEREKHPLVSVIFSKIALLHGCF